jgi:hypothetical protein
VARFLSPDWVTAFDEAAAAVVLDVPADGASLAVAGGAYATGLVALDGTNAGVGVTVLVAEQRLHLTHGVTGDAAVTVRLDENAARVFMAGAWSPASLADGGAQVRGDLSVLEATGAALRAVHPLVAALFEVGSP